MPSAAFPACPTDRPRTSLAAAGVALLALVAYANSWGVPFLYDDSTAVVANPSLASLWPLTPVLTPPAHQTTSGRPLVNLTLAVNHAFGGLAVGGYHAVNLLIHVLAALALFGLVRRTLSLARLRPRFGQDATLIGWVVATLWLVHPLQSEAVTYVVQRAESLAGLCYLLTLYCFVRASSADGDRGGRWQILAVVACLLGMASKEVMVSAPLAALVFDRLFVAPSWRAALTARRWLYAGLAGTWLLLAWLVISTGGTRDGSAGFGGELSALDYLRIQAVAIPHYLTLAVWPRGLVFDYGRQIPVTAGQIAIGLSLLASLALATALALRRNHAAAVLGFCFFAVLAPSSSLVPIATEPMAEHRMYLPLAAVVAALVLASYRAGGRKALLAFLPVAGVLTIATFERNRVYATALSLWQDTVAQRPDNPRARNQFGYALFLADRAEEAQAQFEESVRLEPDGADSHYNLATVYLHFNRNAEAIAHFQKTLDSSPDYPAAETNLGLALVQAGQPDQAIPHYRRSLLQDPTSATAHNDLGVALAQTGELTAAHAEFAEAVRLAPDYAEAHNNLGNAEFKLAHLPPAIREFAAALRLKPDYAEAHNNLALALDQTGRVAEAIVQYREVVRLAPDYVQARERIAALSHRSPL